MGLVATSPNRRTVLGLLLGTGLVASRAGTPQTAAVVCRPPPSVVLDYDVQGRISGFNFRADGQLDWRLDANGYLARLSLSMPLLGKREQTSEGLIGPDGLQPERFVDRRRSKQRQVQFERADHRIRFGNDAAVTDLLPGAQDRLSLFMQLAGLMRAQPRKSGEHVEFQVAGFGDAEVWRFDIGAQQRLDLPAGQLGAVHIARAPRKPNDSRVELWLSPELDHLPVRLRVTQPEGDVADQLLARRP
ncbi:MAG: DUF3108 domain-containing protein [Hydrogenophaga sp.]|uniref:DUF3108 domain-containing protein n=1 Tax=Hydrogenophaga sp. TaxID=1904254 RepID=UPI001DB8861D|nr:DUF3108 domain-containing protein [Hydrogenophaga sp.]MBX3609513.1 DUF3108 domain-containing protein [Hydrogenophaga sp.]